jgi:hypothetical protein
MKLSDGSRLAAPNYKHALLRILHRDVESTLASLFTDPATVNILPSGREPRRDRK